jgi:hypothetical protein
MSSVKVGNVPGLLGLFELDEAGRLLYSSLETPEGLIRAHEYDGFNFFTEICPLSSSLTNADAFHRRFDLFRAAEVPLRTFNFTFDCLEGPKEVKVLLAQVQKGSGHKAFLLYLRAAGA